MIKVGDRNVKEMFVGDRRVLKIFVGDRLAYNYTNEERVEIIVPADFWYKLSTFKLTDSDGTTLIDAYDIYAPWEPIREHAMGVWTVGYGNYCSYNSDYDYISIVLYKSNGEITVETSLPSIFQYRKGGTTSNSTKETYTLTGPIIINPFEGYSIEYRYIPNFTIQHSYFKESTEFNVYFSDHAMREYLEIPDCTFKGRALGYNSVISIRTNDSSIDVSGVAYDPYLYFYISGIYTYRWIDDFESTRENTNGVISMSDILNGYKYTIANSYY